MKRLLFIIGCGLAVAIFVDLFFYLIMEFARFQSAIISLLSWIVFNQLVNFIATEK